MHHDAPRAVDLRPIYASNTGIVSRSCVHRASFIASSTEIRSCAKRHQLVHRGKLQSLRILQILCRRNGLRAICGVQLVRRQELETVEQGRKTVPASRVRAVTMAVHATQRVNQRPLQPGRVRGSLAWHSRELAFRPGPLAVERPEAMNCVYAVVFVSPDDGNGI